MAERIEMAETTGSISISRMYEWYSKMLDKQVYELTKEERVVAVFNYIVSGQHIKDLNATD